MERYAFDGYNQLTRDEIHLIFDQVNLGAGAGSCADISTSIRSKNYHVPIEISVCNVASVLGRRHAQFAKAIIFILPPFPSLIRTVSRLFTQTYASLTGVGRWHYVFSSHFRRAAIKRRWIPVTIAETFVFYRSIKAFDKIELKTELICWNERCFFRAPDFFVTRRSESHLAFRGHCPLREKTFATR